ncbi:hypothetical protein J6590_098590 [Homalodisca vitripennis]|nr:hypothetical protein J6590_098590 [Homalodisca vitripennis]
MTRNIVSADDFATWISKHKIGLGLSSSSIMQYRKLFSENFPFNTCSLLSVLTGETGREVVSLLPRLRYSDHYTSYGISTASSLDDG